MKIIYQSFDGQQFDNEEDCKTYEEGLCPPQFYERAKQFVKEIKEYCHEVADSMQCEECPFYGICHIMVYDWELD